jgi:2-succinyl-5-enolpyruvyl-6-hydroxy-3-cyclohexene-1-carboxylate synthase
VVDHVAGCPGAVVVFIGAAGTHGTVAFLSSKDCGAETNRAAVKQWRAVDSISTTITDNLFVQNSRSVRDVDRTGSDVPHPLLLR